MRTARRALLRSLARVAIAAAWIASASPGQNPESRLIDDQPRIEIGRPPAVAAPADSRLPRPLRPTQDDALRTEHDRIDLDLDLKERRERRGEGESIESSWVAAVIFVMAGAALLLVITWVRRRGGH
jgi:hypothetical protein